MHRQFRSRLPACCSTCRRRRSAKRCNAIPGNRIVSILLLNGRRSTRRHADDKPADKTVLDAAQKPRRRPPHLRTSGCSSASPGSAANCRRSIGCAPSIRAMPRPRRARAPTAWLFCRFAPARLMTAEDLVYFGTNPEQFFAFARVRARSCPAPAFTNECWVPPRSRFAFRAIGLAIGARSPPVSTGFSLNCIRSEIAGPAAEKSCDRRPFRPNPYPKSAFQEYRLLRRFSSSTNKTPMNSSPR